MPCTVHDDQHQSADCRHRRRLRDMVMFRDAFVLLERMIYAQLSVPSLLYA
jgi:hypothetical protein